jgi:hypothetical protein
MRNALLLMFWLITLAGSIAMLAEAYRVEMQAREADRRAEARNAAWFATLRAAGAYLAR